MFIIHKVNSPLPEGHYITIEGRKWLIENLTINGSAKICMRLKDPARFESQVLTLCSLTEFLEFLDKKNN